MTARRTQRADEATALDLLLKADYAGLAKLIGYTVEQVERMLDRRDDHDDELDDDEDDDWFFDEEEDGEGGDAFA
jgi:hypothetical protein